MSEKRQYLVLNPLAHGGRIERGETIWLTDSEAHNIGSDLVRLLEEVKIEEPAPETDLDDMKLPELREKAKSLGLSTSGSKADLLERVRLHLA